MSHSDFPSVPDGWRLTPLKHLTTSSGGMTPSKDRADFWDGSVPWVSPKDMKQPLLEDSIDHVTELAVASTGLKLHAVDSVMVVTRGMILAHTFPVARNTVPVTINQDMKALRARPGVDTRYLAWMMKGLESLMLSLTDESAHGTKALRTDQWENLRVPMPLPGQQERIANFLDEQTAQIDALIAEKNRLITVLEESLEGAIERAVAGGAELTVPLKRAADRIITGPFGSALHSSDYINDGVPVINPSHIFEDGLRPDAAVGVTAEMAESLSAYFLNEGELVVGRRGEMGRCAVVPSHGAAWLCGTGCLLVTPDYRKTRSDYLQLVVSSRAARDWLSLESVGSTMENLNAEILGRLPGYFPSLQEQSSRVQAATSARAGHSSLIAHVWEHIDRLREYRSSLISAAVTGQLDINAFKVAA